MPEILQHEQAEIQLLDLPGGKRRIQVNPHSADLYIHRNGWETAYPIELIQRILDQKGPSYLCDEIAREEDPLYVPLNLEIAIFSFVDEDHFGPGSRILDFGCGTGASGVFLGQHFPEAEIIGVELLAESLEIARARQDFYGLSNLRFLQSLSGDQLPPDLGEFDGIMLSAVFEHLLPDERLQLMPALWSMLRPGGMLFLNETPNRLFPMELHTTGLPLLNYLPKGLAHFLARKLSPRVDDDSSWERLLREGIRGGTAGEVFRCLDSNAELVRPHRQGRQDDTDLWYHGSLRRSGDSAKKRTFRSFAKGLSRISGLTLTPEITLALRKRNGRS